MKAIPWGRLLILTRSAVAALVIVGTAASSIAASFGISVLIWQDLIGMPVHWIVLLMAVIILLAVGSDYNLLLVSRFKDEIHAGIKTGVVRSLLMPSIAVLLGRWFWWPQVVYPRGDNHFRKPAQATGLGL